MNGLKASQWPGFPAEYEETEVDDDVGVDNAVKNDLNQLLFGKVTQSKLL